MLFRSLGRATDNKDDLARGQQILRDEALRLGKNVRYYQSLSPRLYAALPNLDQVIDRYLFMSVVESYHNAGGDTAKLDEELAAMGVNLDRSMRLIEAVRRQ